MRHYFKRRKDKKLFRRALCGFRPDKRPEDCIKPIEYYSLKESDIWEGCPECRELVDPEHLALDDAMRGTIKKKIENVGKAYKKGIKELIDEEDKNLKDFINLSLYNK